MNPPSSSENAWKKLSGLAAQAPAEETAMPPGFGTRVVARWKADRRESTLAVFEWLTLRGLAVAAVVFAALTAFGYDALAGVMAGEAPLISGWVDTIAFLP